MQNLKKYKDIHKNEKCFILGAGPSLTRVEKKDLKNVITFAVNGAIAKFDDATYFVTEDQGVSEWSYFYDQLSSSKCIKFFNKDKFVQSKLDRVAWECFTQMENKELYDQYVWEKDKKLYVEDVGLHRNTSEPLTASRTSIATAIHLAHIMGCSPIVLIGCDCQNVNKKNHFWEFENQVKVERIKKEAWWEEYYRKEKQKDMNVHAIQICCFWNVLSNKLDGANVIDCSNGKLKMLPQGDLKNYLNE